MTCGHKGWEAKTPRCDRGPRPRVPGDLRGPRPTDPNRGGLSAPGLTAARKKRRPILVGWIGDLPSSNDCGAGVPPAVVPVPRLPGASRASGCRSANRTGRSPCRTCPFPACPGRQISGSRGPPPGAGRCPRGSVRRGSRRPSRPPRRRPGGCCSIRQRVVPPCRPAVPMGRRAGRQGRPCSTADRSPRRWSGIRGCPFSRYVWLASKIWACNANSQWSKPRGKSASLVQSRHIWPFMPVRNR